MENQSGTEGQEGTWKRGKSERAPQALKWGSSLPAPSQRTDPSPRMTLLTGSCHLFSKVLTGGRTASFRRHWISGEDQDIVLCSNRPVGKTTEKGRRGLGAPVRGKQNLLSNSKQTPVCFSWPLVAAQESTTLN